LIDNKDTYTVIDYKYKYYY